MKKSRLLEIIREEITAALNETTIDVSGDPNKLTPQQRQQQINTARQKTKDRTLGTAANPVDFIEEELLYEVPVYDVSDMEGFKSTLDKFREEEVSKSKALNLLLKKLEDEGTVDTNQLSKDMGVDTATFNNKEIRKFLNRPEDEMFTDKSGEELIDFTPYLEKTDKKRGKVAGEKSEPKEKPESTGKKGRPAGPGATPKKATLSKSDDGFDDVSYSEPKKEKSKKEEPKKEKESSEEKATKAAKSSSKLEKISDDRDALVKVQRQAAEKMKELAQKMKGTEGEERNKIMDELKKINKVKAEVDKKLDKLGF